MNYDSISKAIKKLNPSELARLRSEITALLSLRSGRADHDAHEEENVSDTRFGLWAICDMLQRNGLEYGSVAMLQRHRDFAQFKIQYEGVNKFFGKAKLDKVQRRSLYQIGLKLLYENLVEMGIPVSAVTMMHHIYRVPSLINQQLPGYAQSGLLKLVVAQRDKAEVG